MAKKTAPPAAYDVHPGVAMVQKWADELPAKTGRTLDEWATLVRQRKAEPAAARDWLKTEYGFGTNYAGWIVEYTAGTATWDGDPASYLRAAPQYVDGMFAGAKAHLRPIAEAVIAFARGLGADVKVCPCKTIIPLYRKRVFAELKPATRTRLELALRLGEVPYSDALAANPRAKGNDKLRHLIALHDATDFDAAAKRWLKTAYQGDE
jgi:hypothetical protein